MDALPFSLLALGWISKQHAKANLFGVFAALREQRINEQNSFTFFFKLLSYFLSLVLPYSYGPKPIKEGKSDLNYFLWNAVRAFITFFSFVRLCMKFHTFFAFIKLSFSKIILRLMLQVIRLSRILHKTLSRPSSKNVV